MKIAYINKLPLNSDNKNKLSIINEIVEEYVADNYILTLRQLYYQLVSRDVIPNNQKEYTKLSTLLKKGRMAGIVDWDAIEDRGRQPKLPYWVHGVKHALDDTIEQYRLNRQQEQDIYIEVWVEKDALSNVFLRVTEKYHVNLMVNKGYSSCSAMHEAFKRFKKNMVLYNQSGLILYFGDHDPSGIDMARDIDDRLTEFGIDNYGKFDILRPALTMPQIRQFNCPENPAKLSDPRAGWYVEKYGYQSWELDALPPKELIKIIEKNVRDNINIAQYKRMLDLEKQHIGTLTDFSNQIPED